ncbi:MAG: hypothetical protein H7177_08455 [Rhizobacter sp.]|nr:hypothetical protein [Bacteriovorax sp.]
MSNLVTKEKIFLNEDNDNQNNQGFNVVEAADKVLKIMYNSSGYELKSQEHTITESKSIKRLPATTDISCIVIDKIKVTEAAKITFETTDDETYSIAGGQTTVQDKSEDLEKDMNTFLSAVQKDIIVETTEIVEKQTLTYVKKEIRLKNKYFFKAKDHKSFYQVGDSFYQDFKKGERLFLFTGLKAQIDQQKTILGIASFINYFDTAKILVITTASDNSFFKKILTESEGENLQLAEGVDLDIYKHEGINFIDLDCIARACMQNPSTDYEQIVAVLNKHFDCILCDLPEVLDKKSPHLEFYLPVYKIANSVSFIVASNKSSFGKVEKLMNYFSSYNIKIKGALFSDNLGESR